MGFGASSKLQDLKNTGTFPQLFSLPPRPLLTLYSYLSPISVHLTWEGSLHCDSAMGHHAFRSLVYPLLTSTDFKPGSRNLHIGQEKKGRTW